MTSQPDELSAVLDSIYEASDCAVPWNGVLRGLAPYFDADAGHQFQVDPRGALIGPPCGHGRVVDRLREYHDGYQAQDQRLSIAIANPGVAFSDVEAIDPCAFERTALYREHLAPAGLRYSLFASVAVGDGAFAWQGFYRGRERGPFSPAEVAGLARLLPHLARTLRMRGLTQALRQQRGDLQVLLDRLAPAALVVDLRGRILCASARAGALLQAADGIRSAEGRLTARDRRPGEAISAAIEAVGRRHDGEREGPEPAVVEVWREDRLPLRLMFLPFSPHAPAPIGGSERVLVVVHDPQSVQHLDPEAVGTLHGLTPAEARLAVALSEGRSVLEFARTHDKSEHTVRTQLKRILEKTETRRQSELVRLLLTSGVAQ